MNQPAKKVNLTRIAEICGVSKMTVSRAIRNDPNVAESTRQLVLRVAERENYLPSGYNGPDGDACLKQYYVLFQKDASLQDGYFGDIIRTIQQDLFQRGRSCSFGIIEDDYQEFLKLFGMLQTANVGGVVIVGTASADAVNTLIRHFGNVVLVDNPGGPDLAGPCGAVFCENAYGCKMAVRHLLDLARRRILLITGPEGHYFSTAMIDGYRQAHAERGLEVDPARIVRGDFHINGAYQAVKEAGAPFDAVFSNDEGACGAVRALSERGIAVPDDVSIVGFDNLQIGEVITPALTTVDVHREEMGKKAVELLLRLESSESTEDVLERVSLYPKLVVRDSCGGRRRT